MNASTSAIASSTSSPRRRIRSTAVQVWKASPASAYRSVTRRNRPGAGSMKGAAASAKSISSSGVVLIRDREHVVEDRNALVELLAGDRQRRADHDDVPMRHQIEPAIERRLRQARDGCSSVAARVEGDEHLARLAVLDELETPERPEPAHVADRRVLRGELVELLAEYLAVRRGLLDDPLLAERLDRRNGARARERMAAVGEAAGERAGADPLRDRLADRHRAERHVPGV